MIPALPRYLKHPSAAVLALTFGLFTIFADCQKGLADDSGLQRYARTEAHMGTRFEIIAYCDSPSKCKAAMDEAFREIESLDAMLSNYKSDSELNQFCKGSPHNDYVRISKPMFEVLTQSQQISKQTDGAFDVTIGPLTKLWRRARRQKALPSDAKIGDARSSVGYHAIHLDKKAEKARLTLPGMRIDLGGIAKGYAIDRALVAMKRNGIERTLVNGGGDVAVGKPPPGRDHWRVQVFDGTNEPRRILKLVNRAVATSGDLYQFVEIDGKRYSHLVNPKTGIGLTSFVSCTVIADNATTADGWASAIALVGPKKGLRLVAEIPNCEATIRERVGDTTETKSTKNYPAQSN